MNLRHRHILLVVAIALAASNGGIAARQQDREPDKSLLAGSELTYKEEGGLAGRVREARLVANSGRVEVQYRPGDAYSESAQMRGTLDAARYLSLWREAERIDAWRIASPRPSRGMDLIRYELGIRARDRTHTIRWDDGTPLADGIGLASELGRRVLAIARESTTER